MRNAAHMREVEPADIPVPEPGEEPHNSPIAAPALGYSILANIGDEKQITVQCFADSQEPLRSIHDKIDRAMAVIDRQKAKGRVRDLRGELDKMSSTLRQLEEDLGKLETNFEANQDAIDTRIADCVRTKQALGEEAQARGRVKPVGQEGARFNALTREVESLNEQKAKAQAERQQARDNIAVSIGRYQEEIARAEAQIIECEALITDGG